MLTRQWSQCLSLHIKWGFSLRISSVNVTKSSGNCGFGYIYWRNPWWKLLLCVCVCVCAVCVMMVICKIATTDLKFTGKISQPSRKLSKNIFNSCHRSISSWLISSPRSRFSSSDRKSNFLENFPLPSISFYTCKTLQLIRSLRKPRCMPDLYITSLGHQCHPLHSNYMKLYVAKTFRDSNFTKMDRKRNHLWDKTEFLTTNFSWKRNPCLVKNINSM